MPCWNGRAAESPSRLPPQTLDDSALVRASVTASAQIEQLGSARRAWPSRLCTERECRGTLHSRRGRAAPEAEGWAGRGPRRRARVRRTESERGTTAKAARRAGRRRHACALLLRGGSAERERRRGRTGGWRTCTKAEGGLAGRCRCSAACPKAEGGCSSGRRRRCRAECIRHGCRGSGWAGYWLTEAESRGWRATGLCAAAEREAWSGRSGRSG